MQYFSLNRLITTTIVICLLSSLTGCASLSQSHERSNLLSNNTALPQQPDITITDNAQQTAVSQQTAKANSPAELFTYATTLSMREINFVYKGKYVIENNCLYFVQSDNKYLSPIFYPDRAILFENENALSLNGTKVTLGEEVITSGKIKDRLQGYYLRKGDVVIDEPENHTCLTKPAIFMSGRVVSP